MSGADVRRRTRPMSLSAKASTPVSDSSVSMFMRSWSATTIAWALRVVCLIEADPRRAADARTSSRSSRRARAPRPAHPLRGRSDRLARHPARPRAERSPTAARMPPDAPRHRCRSRRCASAGPRQHDDLVAGAQHATGEPARIATIIGVQALAVGLRSGAAPSPQDTAAPGRMTHWTGKRTGAPSGCSASTRHSRDARAVSGPSTRACVPSGDDVIAR